MLRKRLRDCFFRFLEKPSNPATVSVRLQGISRDYAVAGPTDAAGLWFDDAGQRTAGRQHVVEHFSRAYHANSMQNLYHIISGDNKESSRMSAK